MPVLYLFLSSRNISLLGFSRRKVFSYHFHTFVTGSMKLIQSLTKLLKLPFIPSDIRQKGLLHLTQVKRDTQLRKCNRVTGRHYGGNEVTPSFLLLNGIFRQTKRPIVARSPLRQPQTRALKAVSQYCIKYSLQNWLLYLSTITIHHFQLRSLVGLWNSYHFL